MPSTYLSHQAPVLALKMVAPRHLDGTALVLGSMAPDWTYVLHGSRFRIDAHGWPALALFCVPAAVAAVWLVRLAAPTLSYRLASIGLPVAEFRLVGYRRPTVIVTAGSALLGALSHVGWDAFTHDFRWGGQRFAILREEVLVVAGRSLTGAAVLQRISTVIGAVITVALLYRIVRRRLLSHWLERPVPEQQPVPRGNAAAFWVTVASGTALGLLWGLSGPLSAPTFVNRVALAAGGALVAAALVPSGQPARRRRRHADRTRIGP